MSYFSSRFASHFSGPARLMVRPFRGYARLAADEEGPGAIASGVGRLLFVLAAFVAVTTTGRFAPLEIVGATVSFAWVPVVQLFSLAIAVRLLARRTPIARAFALYLEGQGPWLALFLVVAGGCLVAPDPARLLFRVVPPLVLVTHVWSIVLTFALFRSALALGRGRAAAATFIYYAVVHAVVVAYFVAAGQLLPILPP